MEKTVSELHGLRRPAGEAEGRLEREHLRDEQLEPFRAGTWVPHGELRDPNPRSGGGQGWNLAAMTF